MEIYIGVWFGCCEFSLFYNEYSPVSLTHSHYLRCRGNDIENVLDETFSVTEDNFGKICTVDLIPGGADIPVTNDNKKAYVDAIVQYRVQKCVKEQFEAFIEGLSEIVPTKLLRVFDERELELLIGGVTELDMYVVSFLYLHFQQRCCFLGTIGLNSRIIAGTINPTK
jgi:hypothetical protein